MNTILQQLYDGEISPADQYSPLIEKYKAMRKEQYSHYADFVKTLEMLQPSLRKRFEEIMDEQMDTVSMELSEMFIGGFRLGARMMVEVFDEKCENTLDE